jgi:hypothetical protein
MRATLADVSLARYARRFVWLKLDFDKTENGPFVEGREVSSTPTFFVIDSRDEQATATQEGAMTLGELRAFLERGERAFEGRSGAPAETALERGDALLARKDVQGAIAADRDALRLGGPDWADRDRAVAALTMALADAGDPEACAETAVAQAPGLPRREAFGRVVLAGLGCSDGGTAWGQRAREALRPLAIEAIALPSTVRDHRFKLYQELMGEADERGDRATVERLGGAWLAEIDETRPGSDDERSALDIARVDAAQILSDPLRVLPALRESERAMPKNFNASLRVAQMELAAKRPGEAVAACDRGLAHATGPLGVAWLMQVKAQALVRSGRPEEARLVLREALAAAGRIGPSSPRKNNLAMITRALEEVDRAAHN